MGIDGFPVNRFNDVLVYLEYYTEPRDEVTLTVIKEGKEVDLNVMLGERPPPE
ncbi:MAG: hypothetical protein GTN76_10075 [Candidatus Aenigmarchaeota archaeon]|nr:hypothetical protein [Candidatus Aenigmarchaeota archaeon]